MVTPERPQSWSRFHQAVSDEISAAFIGFIIVVVSVHIVVVFLVHLIVADLRLLDPLQPTVKIIRYFTDDIEGTEQ